MVVAPVRAELLLRGEEHAFGLRGIVPVSAKAAAERIVVQAESAHEQAALHTVYE